MSYVVENTSPNIVFVMADDMGYGDPGCYGAEKIQTPNIDAVAAEGIRCTDVHASAAVCTPSRYSVLTGRYAWRTRLKERVQCGHGAPLIKTGRRTVAEVLKSKGYRTGAFGKWHLGFEYVYKDGTKVPVDKSYLAPDDADADYMDFDYSKPLLGGPLDHGFDEFFGISGSLDMPPYCFIKGRKTLGIPHIPKEKITQQKDGLTVNGWDDSLVDVKFTEKACDFIKRSVAEQHPFFAYVPLSSPHRPCVPPDFMRGKSSAGTRGDMVMTADWCLGEILNLISDLNISDDTLVIFTSDNGATVVDYFGRSHGHKANGDLRGHKTDIYEGGHRIPFVAKWPGVIKPGAISNSLFGLVDLMATVCEITGYECNEDEAPDSVSFLPVLTDPESAVRDTIINHSAFGMFAIRSKDWKLVDGLGSGGRSQPSFHEPERDGETGQLYDMRDDCWEQLNKYLKEPGLVESLMSDLVEIKNGQKKEYFNPS